MASSIRAWLDGLGLAGYADAFEENEINLDLAADLNDSDLKDLGVSTMGRRKILIRAIGALAVPGVSADDADDMVSPAKNAPSVSPSAERRQLTVMFCDLVGSTALSQQLDPEDLRDVMRRYQDAVVNAVTRYGGHVAKYLGDGVLAYFGWPQAYEDQAERAVRAGLNAVVAVSSEQMAGHAALAARVGIATGQVVVGDLVGESGSDVEAVSGETPNLAARLQDVAEPGQVVIGEPTYRLVGQTFNVDDLGAHNLKGFKAAVQAWSIVGEVVAESRFEAAHSGGTTRFVGREAELQLLLDRWRLALGGEGQVVLISGEAGIGKSRLMQGLHDQVAESDHFRVRYQCSSYHSNSALYPTIQQLQYACGFRPNDDSEHKLDKLASMLRETDDNVESHTALFAHLLSLPYETRHGALEQTSQQTKELLLKALVSHLMQLAAHKPVLFLFEDSHWIDPTSLELLELIIGHLQQARVLLIITHRPEWQLPPSGHNHVTSLQLNRLGKAQVAEIVGAIAGDHVPKDVMARIVARTDGVPLFIEELTKSLVESGFDVAEADIPDSLQSSLLARIDRLGTEAKKIAQIGAVLGREFSYDLVLPVAEMTAVDLEVALDRLTGSELVFRSGTSHDARYTFKHALIQEAAYASLLRSRREQLHGKIADSLTNSPSGTAPEVMAHHLTAANRHDAAAIAWAKAGTLAQNRSAMAEAASAFEHAIEQLHNLPRSEDLKRRELELLGRLNVAVMNCHGPASVQTEQVQRRSSALAEDLNDRKSWFRVEWALWRIQNARAEYTESIPMAKKLLEDAKSRADVDYEVQAHHALFSSYLFQGNLQGTCEHADRVLAIYDVERHADHAMAFGGHDARECGLINSGNALFALGYPEQAIARNSQGLEHAAELGHPQIIGHAYNWANVLPQLLDDLETLESRLNYIAPLIDKFGLEIYFTEVQLLKAWLAVRTEQDRHAAVAMREYLERRRSMGTVFVQTYFLTLIADAWQRLGEPEESIRAAQEGISCARKTGEHFFLAELYRILGIAHITRGRQAFDQAQQALETAIKDARLRSARSYELRATTVLARLWNDQGRRNEAYDKLLPAYDWFTEGFDTPDLIEAKALLDEMN